MDRAFRAFRLAVIALVLVALADVGSAASNALTVSDAAQTKTCPTDGTTAPSITLAPVPSGTQYTWFVTVQSETVFLCRAATCATGGVPLVVGTQLKLDFQGLTVISCRSTGGTGLLTVNPAAL